MSEYSRENREKFFKGKQISLYLEKIKNWSKQSEKFTNIDTVNIYQEMDQRMGTIKLVLNNLKDPILEIPPQVVRDCTLIYYDYYSTRSIWHQWIDLGELGLKACEQINDFYSYDNSLYCLYPIFLDIVYTRYFLF